MYEKISKRLVIQDFAGCRAADVGSKGGDGRQALVSDTGRDGSQRRSQRCSSARAVQCHGVRTSEETYLHCCNSHNHATFTQAST
ncbi:unnamed protein product [Ceratitis capitata]|uniref:(Mediterranean fruit fly) hypothetical protein n=1 Tax=Ceratitis capitata TaxID=7213 RepID=A0A811UJZ6_CERCA|nr:unnamed protein product [Ceratitis capitata]